MNTATPKLAEIALRIRNHLRRLEKDPSFNRRRNFDKEKKQWVVLPIGETMSGHGTLYSAGAYAAGSKVGVIYVTYQGAIMLSKAEALEYLEYLEWLDAGNEGTHRDMEKK